MSYEEKYDNGVWYWRGTPDGEWIAMGKHQLAQKLVAAQRELAAWRKAASEMADRYPNEWCITNGFVTSRVSELLAQEGGK